MEAAFSYVLNRISGSNCWDEFPCMDDWEFFPAVTRIDRGALTTLLGYAGADAFPSPRLQLSFY